MFAAIAILLCAILVTLAGACFTMSTNARARSAHAKHVTRRKAQALALRAEHARQVAEHNAYMSQRERAPYPFHA